MENWQKEIESAVKFNHGCIFGGYVRDMIAGILPKDIDVYFPADPERFMVDAIRIQSFMVDAIRILGESDDFPPIHGDVIVSRPLGEYMTYRLVQGNRKVDISFVENPWAADKIDCDVNMLQMNGGQIEIGKGAPGIYSISEIIQHIHKREFVRLPGCSQARYIQMLGAGWHETNKSAG